MPFLPGKYIHNKYVRKGGGTTVGKNATGHTLEPHRPPRVFILFSWEEKLVAHFDCTPNVDQYGLLVWRAFFPRSLWYFSRM
jgi:hypothetical protein